MTNLRFQALNIIQRREPATPLENTPKISELFGVNVFSEDQMQQYLSEDVFEELQDAISRGTTLDRGFADKVANGMKMWAMSKGVSHYTHWFQPLTGLTAEKHDAFLAFDNGRAMESFSGSNLAQQEPDASSLPSGGIRNTFEARGYTAWDPSSPAFIFENRFGKTLCIPTIFVSYTGEALDYKAPLLKSTHALDEAATAVCQLFDRNVDSVHATLGVEQEYFLIDRAWFDLRTDLKLTGRTVIGAAPARGQQLDDHYFGSIPERIYGFMKEMETESHKVGIPITTRHNEVAPSQFECAPYFEEQNVAADHNALLMDLMDRVARKHNFRVLLHEKPFAGINGSGKHNNWSMSTDAGKNLLSPGKNPKDNLQFLTFFVNTIKAVYDNADLMRAVIASAGNDHRLGANEAPPAIMSVFIGEELTRILDDIEKPPRSKKKDLPKPYMKLGINKIPEILLDNTDRNRTSPFAFTGNKFEFRAVGSAANSAGAMTVLNSIVANQLIEFRKTIERKVTRGKKKDQAILEVIRDYIKSSKGIRFEGNGYGDEWVEEAARRGLSNIKKTPAALDAFVTDQSIELFEKTQVLTERELRARHEIRLEDYTKKIEIEARVMTEMLTNQIIPACLKYQSEVLANIENMQELGFGEELYSVQKGIVIKISELVHALHNSISELEKELDAAEEQTDSRSVAVHIADKVIPWMDTARAKADSLENIVSDEYWPFPKYREMLFIR